MRIESASPDTKISKSFRAYLAKEITPAIQEYLMNNPVYCDLYTREMVTEISRVPTWKNPNEWEIVATAEKNYNSPGFRGVSFRCKGGDGEYRTTGKTVAQAFGYLIKEPRVPLVEFAVAENGDVHLKDKPYSRLNLHYPEQFWQLRSWLESNPATLKLPNILVAPDSVWRWLQNIALTCGDSHFFGSNTFGFQFQHDGHQEYSFLMPRGVVDDICYPTNLGRSLSDFHNNRRRKCSGQNAPWRCRLWTWGDRSIRYKHHYLGEGNSPLESLDAACQAAKDLVKVSRSGNIRLGSSRSPTWKFSFETAKWSALGKYSEELTFWDFDSYVREQVWDKAQAHPALANRLLLEMALR